MSGVRGVRGVRAARATSATGATGRLRPRTRRRTASLVLVAAVLVVGVAALGVGDYPLAPLEVLRALAGGDGFASTIVLEWRLPRVLAALVLGAALGVSGALFQSLTQNPLGSPDVIGFATGSYTGAIVVLVAGGTSTAATAGGALVGGLGTALLVYLLSYRRGVQGLRLVVVGIGVTAVLHSVNSWLLLRARTEVALTANFWGSGSIALVGWEQLLPTAGLLALLVPAVLAVAGPLRQLELGDDAARAHGTRVEGARLAVVLVGVALTAAVTAIAGPIAFVALAAPQLARRLTRSAGVPLGASALTAGLLLLVADLVAQHVAPSPIPVGLVTLVLGGAYLVSLLARETRRSS